MLSNTTDLRRTLNYITNKQKIILWCLCSVMVLAIFCGLNYGGVKIPITDWFSEDFSELKREIIVNVRGPRVLLAAIIGAALGQAGAALQGLFRNPLAEPGLIGVSAGAALGAVLSIVVLPNLLNQLGGGIYMTPFAAILGSFTVIYILYLLTGGFKRDGITYILLIGIALNAFATVGIGIMTFISTDSQLRGLTFWLMGSFGGATSEMVIPFTSIIFISLFVLISVARKIDILQLGEIEALRLGVDVKRLKMIIIFSCALMVGLSVSLAGIVGFVGLVVPHIVRLLGGVNHRYLLMGSAILGSGLTILSDLLARTMIQPAELPVGLVTSALGAPFFLWLILRVKRT